MTPSIKKAADVAWETCARSSSAYIHLIQSGFKADPEGTEPELRKYLIGKPHYVAAMGYADLVEQFRGHPEMYNAREDTGATPLHYAASRGRFRKGDKVFPGAQAVEAFLEIGADPNVQDEDGATPLHVAAGSGDYQAVKALIHAGGDVDEENNDGWTPLHFAAISGHAKAAALLFRAGADATAEDHHGNRPLDVALAMGNIRTAALVRGPKAPAPLPEDM
jgi:cytohesin